MNLTGQCISPFHKDAMAFPCGKCYPCLRRRISGWSFRLMKEAESCDSASFVTFTYDTDHVPITPKGFMTLRKRDFQLFMKSLRKAHTARPQAPPQKQGGHVGAKPIRYFCVGEYGKKSWRPHYHAIMFNVDLAVLVGQKMSLQIKRGNVPLDGTCSLTCEYWPHGHITIGQLSEASAGYTLKYVMKEARIPLHRNDDRARECQLISQRLGVGYLNDRSKDWHHANLFERYYLPLKDGKKAALPRYYREKLYDKETRELIGQALQTQRDNEDSEVLGPQEKAALKRHSDVKIKVSRLNNHL